MTTPVLSIVDYDAWRKGYMPPSEHQLVDELSYRGARVVMSSVHDDFAIWVVCRGGHLPRATRLKLHDAVMESIDFFFEQKKAESYSGQIGPWFDPSHPMNQ
jgi:hypothetical protein